MPLILTLKQESFLRKKYFDAVLPFEMVETGTLAFRFASLMTGAVREPARGSRAHERCNVHVV